MAAVAELASRVALAGARVNVNSQKAGGRRVNAKAMRCVAEEATSTADATATSGTPVRKTSMLVIGATGTLGRQVVRRALDEGYDVRCLVRPRMNPADFLRDWGATTVSGDLTKPETLPAAFVGIHTVIDASAARPEEDSYVIDWKAKVACIQTAAAMGKGGRNEGKSGGKSCFLFGRGGAKKIKP
jgi:hypothetical protein